MKCIIALFAGLALCLSGCSTLPDGSRAPNDAAIKGLSYTLTIGTLASASPAKRRQLAPYISALAKGIRALSGGTVPTSEEITAAIALWRTPDPLIVEAAQALAGLYSTYYDGIKGNPALALRVLNDIATGVDKAAAAVAN